MNHLVEPKAGSRANWARSSKWLLLSGAAVFASSAAEAQTQPAAPGSLDVVVVYAQKRSEDIQKVPVTVDAISAVQLKDHQIQTVADLTSSIPGLRSDDVAGMSNIAIRGVGTTFTTGAGESSVAVHIDGVYIPQPKAALMGEDDLNQVEVLRGPQGTLYGRNSTAGVINFITASPSATPEGQVSVRYGNYNDVRVEGDVSGPILDDLRGRIYLTGEHHDGWGRDLVTGQQLLDLNAFGGRGSLDWDIKPWWTAELKVGGNRETFAGPLYQPFNANSLVIGLAPPLFSTLTPYDVKSYQHYASNRQLETAILKNDFKINDDLRLTSITGYVHFQSFYNFDGFAAVVQPPFTILVPPYTTLTGALPPVTLSPYTQSDAVSQEFDLKGNWSNLKWLTGLYYYHEDQKNRSLSLFDALGALGLLGLSNPADPTSPALRYYTNIVKQSSSRTSISIFTDDTYTVTPSLRVFGGVRGLYETLSQDLLNIHSFGITAPNQIPVTSCAPGSPNQSLDESAVTGRAGAEYDLTSHAMTYAEYSTGYKSGGFSQTQCNNPYKPETIESTEVGLKSRWLDNHLTLNVSGYHYEISNLEIETATLFGVPIVNAPKSHVWGLDLSFIARLTDHLKVDGSATFLDARYDQFCNQDATFGVPTCAVQGGATAPAGSNLTGTPLNKSPHASGTVGVSYGWTTPVGDLDLRAETYMTTAYHLREFNFPYTNQAPYQLVSLYATLKLDHDKYEVRLYGKNIGDKKYVTGIDGILTGAVASYSAPELYGMEFSLKF
ncbi:MAG TPA: TonB-dependent receptor [Caulobacteraceae bacterium]|jgi:iron complex outermembrane receptor protein